MVFLIPEIADNLQLKPNLEPMDSAQPLTQVLEPYPNIVPNPFSASIAPEQVSALMPLTEKHRAEIVRKISEGLRFWYIDGGKADQMAIGIIEKLQKGGYDHYTSPIEFKNRLLQDLRSICPDKHLDFLYDAIPISADDPDRILADLTPEQLTVEQQKVCAEQQEKWINSIPDHWIHGEMRGRIGVLTIDFFPPHENPLVREKIAASMQTIADADGLIVNLSSNNGGDPGTVALVYSYFVDQKELVNRIYQRSNNQWEETFANPDECLGGRFGGEKPIVCITSEKTFSGGEELAYDLQQSGRGSIIGQTTPGGAHPIKYYVLDDHLALVIPFQKAVNPHTGTNWEGVGIIPNKTLEKGSDPIKEAINMLRSHQDCCAIL